MTACSLYIVLATKLRTLNYRCSLTAATVALLIVSPLIRPFLPLLSSITTPSLVLFAMPRIQQRLFPLRVSSASNDIILAPKNVNPNAINSTSEVEEFCY